MPVNMRHRVGELPPYAANRPHSPSCCRIAGMSGEE